MAVSITPVVPTMIPIDFGQIFFNGLNTSLPLIFKTLLAFWYVWPLFLAYGIYSFGHKIYHNHILSKAGMHEIDIMAPTDFELYITNLFSRLGYKSQHVGHTGDFGVDITAEREGKKIAIQAKRYGYKNKVGEDAVREAFAGINMYGCTKAMVVTNSFFTPKAIKLAKSDNVELWDRYALSNSIILANKLDTNH